MPRNIINQSLKRTTIFTQNIETVAKNLGRTFSSKEASLSLSFSLKSKEANTKRGGCHVRSRLFFDSSSTRSSYPYFRRENRVWKSSLTRASHLLPFPLTLLGGRGWDELQSFAWHNNRYNNGVMQLYMG